MNALGFNSLSGILLQVFT